VSDHKASLKKAKNGQTDFDEPEPVRRRFHTDDPTVASLKKLFSTNQRGILLRSDETSAQLQKFDKDGCEGDRAFFLSCWSGQETYHDDRMTRASLLDLSLCLSWMGGIQPNTLKHHLQQATHATKGSDGLMQRFQLICYPVVDQEFKDVDIQIPAELKAEIKQLSIDLDRLCTEKQIDANRQNALKSTGPASIEGKSRASKNAMKHGILSKNLVVSGEKTSEYQAFLQNLIEAFHPEGTMEALLVEKIACLAWRQRRAVQAESSLFHKGLSNEWNRKSLESFFQGREGDCLQNLSRYEANIEKNFYKALNQLKELQKTRKEAFNPTFANGFVW